MGFDIEKILPKNVYDAAVGANNPSASNPFVTGADLIGGGGIYSGSGTLPSTVIVSGNIGAYGIAFSQISEFFVTTQEAAGFTIRDTFAFDGTAQIVGLGLPGIGLLLEMNDGVSGGGIQQINLSGSQATGGIGMVVTDTADSTGLYYAGNYEANFVATSLVTKQYVDTQIAAISDNNGIFTGTNSGATIDSGFVVGLTDTIQWGLGSDNIRLDPSNNQIIFSNTGFGNITGTLIGYAGNTGNQTWTLPDNKSGIIALTSDIPAPDGNGIYDGNGTLPDAFTTSTIPINKGWILDGGVFYRNGQSNSSGVNTIFRSQDLSFNITIQDNGGLTQNNPNAGLLWGIDASRGLTNGGLIVAATGLSGVSWGTIQGKVGDTGINTNQTTYYLHSNTAREGIFDLYRQNVIAGRFKAAVGGVEFSEGDFTIKGASGTSDLFHADEDAETLSFDGVSYTFERNNSIVYFGSGGGRITVTSSGNMIISQANLFNCALQNTFNANTQQINNVKNLGVKTFQFGSGADGVLAWGVGTAPTTDNFNVVQSYTTDGTDLIFRNELGATVDIFSLGADGNGIYDGSGTIPTLTTATITDTLTFSGGDVLTSNKLLAHGDSGANDYQGYQVAFGSGAVHGSFRFTMSSFSSNVGGFNMTDGTVQHQNLIIGTAAYIGNKSNHDLNFRVANLDAITIKQNTLNVGIGTTSPTARLNVVGTSLFTNGDFTIKGASGTTDLFFVDESAETISILGADSSTKFVVKNAANDNVFQVNTSTQSITSNIGGNQWLRLSYPFDAWFNPQGATNGFRFGTTSNLGLNSKITVKGATSTRAAHFQNGNGTSDTVIEDTNGRSYFGSFTGVSKVNIDGDVETINNGNGLIVADATTGTRYRIYVDNGVLSTQLA
jgi:hypothetical protein